MPTPADRAYAAAITAWEAAGRVGPPPTPPQRPPSPRAQLATLTEKAAAADADRTAAAQARAKHRANLQSFLAKNPAARTQADRDRVLEAIAEYLLRDG